MHHAPSEDWIDNRRQAQTPGSDNACKTLMKGKKARDKA